MVIAQVRETGFSTELSPDSEEGEEVPQPTNMLIAKADVQSKEAVFLSWFFIFSFLSIA